WNANFVAGHHYKFSYDWKAPDISPEFFLIGPMKLTNNGDFNYEEPRQWELASDVIPGVPPSQSCAHAAAGAISVSWGASTGSPTSYTVKNVQTGATAVGTSPYTWSAGLVLGNAYTFQVKATNGSGSSAYGGPTGSCTSYMAPATPTVGTASTSGD